MSLLDFSLLQKTFLGFLPFGYGVIRKNVADRVKKIPVLEMKPYMKVSEGKFYFYANICKSANSISQTQPTVEIVNCNICDLSLSILN